jgi:filamentous hemagglutinin family protein
MSMDNGKNRRALLRVKPIALAVTAAFLPWNHAFALPQGGEVVAGQATISRPQGKTLQIDQASQKAILDWRSFSIKRDETVNFLQPNASAVALNRVVGSSSSEIYGAMNANGQVFLVNTNGILFAPGSSVNVGGLVATTLDIRNEDFLSGNYVFQGKPSTGRKGDPQVINRGTIVTTNGYAALFGPQVRNEGVIIANSGSIALSAGDRVSLDMVGDNLIRLNVEQSAVKASIVNSGTLQADGGTVVLRASAAGALLDTVINTTGVIRANALAERNGAIVLDGGSSGVVSVGGSVQAAAGAISVAGNDVRLVREARVDASGHAGGGSVHMDAAGLVVEANASVRADALLSGEGGDIVLSSTGTTSVQGTVSARGAGDGAGGTVETSGRSLTVARAPEVGAGGTWVIAADNIVVNAGAVVPSGSSRIGASLISGELNAGANVVLDAGRGGSSGDLSVDAAIGKTNANSASLTLTAADSVTVRAPISLAGGGLTVNAGALTNASTITTGGGVDVANNIVLNADAFHLAGGAINAGSAVILRPRTGANSFGIEAAGDTTVTNADLASINTSDFVVFGSGMGTTFTGNMIVGENAAVNGGTKNLAFFRSQQPGGTTTIGSQGVTTGGDVIISAGGGAIVSNGGTVRGDEVQLRAREGIGSAAAPVKTAANALAIANAIVPGNIFVSEADHVTLRDITLNVGGILNSTNNFSSGTMAVTADGAINIAGTVQSLGSLTLTAADSVTVNAPISVAGGSLTIDADALTNTSTITSTAGAGVTNNIVLNADAFNLAGGRINATPAVILRPRTGTNSFGIESNADTTLTNADLASITTNDFVVLGSGMGTTFTGNMIIGQNAQLDGGMKNLAFLRSQQPGGTTTIGTHGVATGGDLIVSAGGGAIVSNGGTVRGDEVQLRAREGIGLSAAPVKTAANALGIVNTGAPGNVVVSEADNVTLRDISLNVGGISNSTGNFSSGTMAVTTGGAITIAGRVESVGSLTLTADDSVTVNAPVLVRGSGLTINADALTNTSRIESTAGVGITNNIVLSADAFNLAGGTINAGSAVILRPRTGTHSFGIESSADTIVTNADLASINTNNFVVFGSGMGTTFTGNMIIGQNAQVDGGTKNLAFFRSQQPGGTITIGTNGVATTGDVIVNAGGGAIVSNGGTVRGDEVQLRAREGIGSLLAPVRTAANALGIVNTSFPLVQGSTPVTGDVFVSETDNVTLGDFTLNAGGIFNSTNNFSSGTMALTAGGAIDIAGTVQSLGAMTLDAASIAESAIGRIQAPTLTTTTTGNTLLTGPNAIGAFSGSSSMDITLNNAGALTVSTLNAGGRVSLNNSGDVTLSGQWNSGTASLTTTGDGSDLIVSSTVNSAGRMDLSIAGDLTVRAAGTQHAMLLSNGGQTISARSIAVTSEDGRVADINNFGGDQNITVTGTGLGAGIDVLTLEPAGLARIGSLGNQSIVVAGDHLNVHGLGGGPAIITAAGNQTIAMNGVGAKRITLGSDGAQGLSTISSGGNQTVTGNADVSLVGGSSPIADQSNAVIVNVNALGTQTIEAGNLHLASSAIGGNNSFAGIQAIRQVIHATGNVTLTGGRSGGLSAGARIGGRGGVVSTPTDLTLTAGGNVILTSGEAGNGVSLGSTAAAGSGPFSNDIDIQAVGSVILNAGPGAGARIGGSAAALPAPGDINISAGNGIELNGESQQTVIRTQGNVSLDANYISSASNGFVVANTLTTRSVGDTTLVGPNAVANFNGFGASTGNVTFNNRGDLNVMGMTARNATLTNQGDVTVSGPWNSSTTVIATTGAGSDLLVNNLANSSGAMNVDVAGNLEVISGAASSAELRSSGGQNIRARSLTVTSNGGFASVSNSGLDDQVIEISGGAGIDVQTLASGAPTLPSFAQISAQGGGEQTIRVVDGDRINVNGFRGNAAVFAIGGEQTISITGTGANAITVGSSGALGASNVAGGSSQTVTAGAAGERGSITIVGPQVNNALAGFVSGAVVNGTQTFTTSGLLSITGGTAPNQAANFASGIFHNGSGAQTITAAHISITGGASGTGNTAQIGSFGGPVPANAGHQFINVQDGSITLRGSDGGVNNRAGIFSNGDQTIDGRPNLLLTGGGSAIAGTGSASIATALGRSQTIHAGSIILTNSALANADSAAGITSSHQTIDTTGDVVLSAGAAPVNGGSARIGGGPGGATDVDLTVGGNLILNGGNTPALGAAIGSSGLGTIAFPNRITIHAKDDVILNSGVNGVRIGSALATGTASGDISVSARSIQLNAMAGSAAIRTTGKVTLNAGEVVLTGGAAPNASASIQAGAVDMRVEDSVRLVSGSGLNSTARIETQPGDGVILVFFPTRSEGGYSVNGEANLQKDGSGFFGTVVIDYGAH